MSGPPTIPLLYAPPRRKRRRIMWQRLAAILVVIVATWALAQFGAPLWAKIEHRRAVARAYSLQQACMGFAIPPGTAVYCEGPSAVALAKRASYRLEMTGAQELVPDGRWGPFFCATYHPESWARFVAAEAELSPAASFSGRSVVFLHERASPIGHVRLVMVEFCPVQGGWFRCNVIVPGTRTSLATATLTTSVLSVGRASDGDLLQIMAGQPDPTSSSRFSIECTFNGKACTIDGWLKDDDRVILRPRSGRLESRDEGTYWWPEGGSSQSPAAPPP